MWNKSLPIFRKWAAVNPGQYEIELGRTLFLLGLAHSTGDKTEQGQKELREAKVFLSRYPNSPEAVKLLGLVNQFLKE